MSKREQALKADLEEQRVLAQLRQSARSSAAISDLKRERDALRRELTLSEHRLDLALQLGQAPRRPDPVLPRPGVKHEAAFVLLCSDWHVGERVDSASVSGRNEYSPDIATQRVRKLIEGALWMIESWRSHNAYGWNLATVVLWLGGDIITNVIHPDLAESNYLSPTQELLLAHELATLLIDSLRRHPGIKRIEIPTSWGNHGRDTPDRRVSTAWKRSYEWLLYKQIAKQYANDAKVRVHVGQDEISRLDVLGKKLRFAHGDQFNFAGGVGGITIPLRKWLARLDATEPADVTCCGHWHGFEDLRNAVINNCLIGWSPYGQRVAPYSPASQVCFLLDAKHGKRLATEIMV